MFFDYSNWQDNDIEPPLKENSRPKNLKSSLTDCFYALILFIINVYA